MRLILVRHPETEWQNVKDPETMKAGHRLLGQTDVNLSSKGLERVARLAQLLKSEGINEIYTSSLNRAVTTAKIISKEVCVPVNVVSDIREIDFGDCEGLTFEALEITFPQTHAEYLAQGDNVVFPGGESFAGFRFRILNWLNKLIESRNDETILIVTHGGGVRVILCELLGWPVDTFWKIRQDYCGTSVIGIYGDLRIIERINNKTEL